MAQRMYFDEILTRTESFMQRGRAKDVRSFSGYAATPLFLIRGSEQEQTGEA